MHKLSLVPIVAALATILSGTASAQTSAHAELRGTFVRDASAGANMTAVMDDAVGKVKNPLGRLFTGVSKNRLRDVIAPYAWIQIVPTAEDAARVRTDRWGETALGGSVTWDRTRDRVVGAGETPDDKNDIVRVSTEWRGDKLVQTFRGKDGSRTNVYEVGPEGNTLTMSVTIQSDQLSGPVKYNLVYRRR